MKPKPHHPAGKLQEQAGYWVLSKHSPDWTQEAENRLQKWLAQSDAHPLEYQRALQLWQRLERFKTEDFPLRQSAQRLRAKNLKSRQRVRAVRRGTATGLLALLMAWGLNDYWTTDRYRTAIGQRQTLTLADCSQMTLNTDTEVSVKIDGRRREVRLAHGEAYFKVSHEWDRSFDVVTGNARIRDIGTGFNVQADADSTQVTVTEGEVAMIPDPRLTGNPSLDHLLGIAQYRLNPNGLRQENTAIRLTAGRQLRYSQQGASTPPQLADTAKVTAWRSGRAVFEWATLEEVLLQVQRYHPVRFEFADEKLKRLRLSASFDTGRLAVILDTLQTTFPIKIRRVDDRVLVVGAAKS